MTDRPQIAYPDYDLLGQPRPASMLPMSLGTKWFQRILKTIYRRRAREPEQAEALDEMERDLWEKAHAALGLAVTSAPSRAGWRELLADVERVEWEPTLSRAARRRRALVVQGLAKSCKTTRPLVASNVCQIQFGKRRWKSPVPLGGPLHWRFSPFRLDYYANQQVPSDTRDWVSKSLEKRLVQRGRTRRSPQATRRQVGNQR